MISAIIASYKEPNTIIKAIEALATQLTYRDQIIVTAPDSETRKAARNAKTNLVPFLILTDKGAGKPTALNNALKHATQNLVLLTDGDVEVQPGAVHALLKALNTQDVGIATGRVVATNPPTTCLGYWAYLLTEAFHELRLKHQAVATGYLYLIRKSLIPRLPSETLADDAYISHHVLSQKKNIIYQPDARVHVKYPTTLPDWLRQKKRTAGRVYQLTRQFGVSKIRSFLQEIEASLKIIHHVRTPKHILWLAGLIIFKSYVWSRVFFDYRLWHRTFSRAWERVESTK